MVSHDKHEFKKICLISSAAFSAASCIYGWTAPIAAALGLVAGWDSDCDKSLKQDLDFAIEKALTKTRNSLSADSHIRIVEELSEYAVDPGNLTELILKTETYRKKYCTQKDINLIIQTFEQHFREEIFYSTTLSRQFALSVGVVTLEKLKEINAVLVRQDTKLDHIKHNVAEVNHNAEKILFVLEVAINKFAFILIAMAGCLILGAIFGTQHSNFCLYAFISYLFAALFSYYISTPKTQPFTSMDTTKFPLRKVRFAAAKIAVKALIPTAISIGSYLILVSASGTMRANAIIDSLYIAAGSVLSVGLKQAGKMVVNIR